MLEQGRGARAALDPRAGSSSSSTSATTSRSRATSSACAATRSRSSRPTRSGRCASSSSATRSSGCARSTRSPVRSSRSSISSRCSPRRTTSPTRSASRRRSPASRPSSPSGSPSSRASSKLLEAQRLRMRTTYDLEMLREVGSCSGVENYSMHLDGRGPAPAAVHAARLLPRRLARAWSTSRTSRSRSCTGSSRATVRARTRWSSTGSGCRRRWTTGRCGSRSSSSSVNQVVFLSATPGQYEREISTQIVEQIVRPTGLIDPEVIVKPTKGQIDDLVARDQRAHRSRSARARHDAHEEDVGGPHRLPARAGHPGALPALRDRHARAHRDPAVVAARRVRRARRHQPAAGGPRPPRGVARRDPRRRQGRVPSLGDVAHPDHRPRRAQRRRSGDHVRRPA